MKTILVQVAENEWTMQALHLACAMARNNASGIALLRLVQVYHPSYLGTQLGDSPPSDQEYRNLREYTATAEDYGVELTVQSMQYVTFMEAVIQAAEQLDTPMVFAQVPESRIPYWHKFQVWNLERQFQNQGRQLFTLEKPVQAKTWRPPIRVENVVHND